MPRKPRVDQSGYHHIVNRGVAKRTIFYDSEDFEKFIELLQLTKQRYHFTLHSFCFMSNHYHLLVENDHENLSLIMRQINSQYAQYFNKKYDRVGPLWQGRYKSWYLYDDNYLYLLLRYIEHNPIKAHITKTIGEYRYSSSSLILNSYHMDLLDESILLDKDLFEILGVSLSDDEIKEFEKFKKTKILNSEDKQKVQHKKELAEYFDGYKNIAQRNENILIAVNDGYTQSSIARYLGLTRAAVSNVVRNKGGRYNKI